MCTNFSISIRIIYVNAAYSKSIRVKRLCPRLSECVAVLWTFTTTATHRSCERLRQGGIDTNKQTISKSPNTHFGRQVSVGNAGQYWRRRRRGRDISFGPGGRRAVIVDVFGERLRYARVAVVVVVVGVHGQRPDAGHGQRRANVQRNDFHGVRCSLCRLYGGEHFETAHNNIKYHTTRAQNGRRRRATLNGGRSGTRCTSATDCRRPRAYPSVRRGRLEPPPPPPPRPSPSHYRTGRKRSLIRTTTRFSGGKRTQQLSLQLLTTDDRYSCAGRSRRPHNDVVGAHSIMLRARYRW